MAYRSDLICKAYENPYGIDLEKYHRTICNKKKEQFRLINALNKNNRIVFSDGISLDFELVIHNNLTFLLGDQTCYICSDVIESAYGEELNWINCIVIPGSGKVIGETDIRKSAIIISLFHEIVMQIPTVELFFDFVNSLPNTFSGCTWFKQIYSLSLYIKLVKFWTYTEKIHLLFERGLLYPLEFVIYTVYKNQEVKDESFLRYFIRSLAESTNKIMSNSEIGTFIDNMSSTEIESILAIDMVRENVHINIINDEYFADLLEIDIARRYPQFIDGEYYLNYVRKRADSLFVTSEFKGKYIQSLKKNFRALENRIRKQKGYDGVGTYFMERLLYNKLSADFPCLTIYTQYSPKWLRPQRFDIYILECNLAIEYNGAQHYLPIEFFGGDLGLKYRQELDNLKREKCAENSTYIFEISYQEDFDPVYLSLTEDISNLLNNK